MLNELAGLATLIALLITLILERGRLLAWVKSCATFIARNAWDIATGAFFGILPSLLALLAVRWFQYSDRLPPSLFYLVPLGWLIGSLVLRGLGRWRSIIWKVLPLHASLSTMTVVVLFLVTPARRRPEDPAELLQQALAGNNTSGVQAALERIPLGFPGRDRLQRHVDSLVASDKAEVERIEADGMAAWAHMDSSFDAVTQTLCYFPRGAQPLGVRSEVLLYFCRRNTELIPPTLKVRLLNNTLTPGSITLVSDSVRIEMWATTSPHSEYRDGAHVAWFEVTLDYNAIAQLALIANGGRVIARYQEGQDYADRILQNSEVSRLKVLLAAYELIWQRRYRGPF